jgi:PPOX class probable F420-dependent enzyme
VPKPPVPPGLAAFLREPNPAVVATLRPDGSPHTAATWYDWEDGRVLLNMDESRVRLGHLRRDPRVSLTVLGRADGWYRHVTLAGLVESLEDDPRLDDIDRLALRYTGSRFGTRDRRRVTAWLRVASWHLWPPSS